MTEEKKNTMLIYGDMLRGNGEIYSLQENGEVHFYKEIKEISSKYFSTRTEITEEEARNYVSNPVKLIKEISGSEEEWERESKMV